MTTVSANAPLAYQAIKNRLARLIGSRWRAGSRMPPIADLAKELGTGQRNTHRAVKELVREGILVSRPGMGTYVSGEFQISQLPESEANSAFDLQIAQTPNKLATSRIVLARNNKNRDGFQSHLADLFVQRLNQMGIPVTQAECVGAPGYDVLPDVAMDADAIVLINPPNSLPIEPRPGQIMTVMSMGLDLDLHASERVDFISVDQTGGSMLAGQRLRDAGCQSVAYIGAALRDENNVPMKQYDKTAQTRLEGFERGFGARVADENKIYAYAYDIGVGARMVREFLKLNPRPEGIFCTTDELAAGFVIGGLAAGIEPATDYKLVGFDGQPIGRTLSEGPLTTVEAPLSEMATRAADLLADRLQDINQPVRRLALGCRIFEGQTVVASNTRLKARRIYHT